MAGEGAGKSAAKIRGAGGSAGEGSARGAFLERNEEQHPRQHSLQHPEFSQHSSQHPPQPFSGFPRFLYSVAGRPDLKTSTISGADHFTACGIMIQGGVSARYPPPIAQSFFEIVSQRGGIAPICFVFIGYRASIAEIPPLVGVYRTSTSRGYRTQLAMLRHQKPHSAQQWGIAKTVSRYRAIRGHYVHISCQGWDCLRGLFGKQFPPPLKQYKCAMKHLSQKES